jgi:ABC-type enterochelin transport system, ATPase component
VLHDINFAARYATHIVAVKNGVVEETGSPEEIMEDRILSDIFNTTIKVIDGPDGKIACYH